ncbi:hypothetical protein AB1Y20_019318 [Prymnesium parvum]|uniref:Uncharacterized protein n=1 Tax=Prymnesium parvum TaxID=97485 RepID=A0AB34JU65_PRYPA
MAPLGNSEFTALVERTLTLGLQEMTRARRRSALVIDVISVHRCPHPVLPSPLALPGPLTTRAPVPQDPNCTREPLA